MFTVFRNFIYILLFLLSGCGGLSLKIDSKQISPVSRPLISKATLDSSELKEAIIDLSLSPDLFNKAGFSIPDEVIDHSVHFSFELALNYYFIDSLRENIIQSPNFVLFSFADQFLSPDEGFIPPMPETTPKRETPKLKAKKKEVKPLVKEDEVERKEVKASHSSLSNSVEDHFLSLNSPSQNPLVEGFSWENQIDDFLISAPKLNLEAKDSIPLFSNKETTSTVISLFPSILHEKVKDFINYFQNKADSFFSKALARSQAYEEMMKKIFREKNLPEELFYLALIESGFNPLAVSRAQASGIWQFVSKTARRFGLRVDKWVDERRDPEKSTYAAAEYLKQLYEMFNCWELAAASYNAGEGKILKALKKTRSQNFWDIAQHRYLKTETKKYVPMFLAAMLIAKEPEKYGFANIPYHPPLTYEKIIVPPATSLAWVAKISETDLAELRALNPALKMDKTPPLEDFEIKLPPGKKEVFERNLASQQKFAAPMINRHRVQRGETLGSIARKYKVNLRQLCELNGLSPKDKIKPGSDILLPP